jgi:hypothetical protein
MQRFQIKRSRRQFFFLMTILLASLLAPLGSGRAEVVLDYFVASAQDEGVLLEWETTTESNSNGFYLYRSTKPDRDFTRLNIFFLSDSEVGEGVFYSYLDEQVIPGYTYYYELDAIDFDGSRVTYGPVRVNFQVQTVNTPTATLRSGLQTATPTLTATSTLGTLNPTQRTPTPTPTGLILLLPSATVTPSPTPTEADATTPEPTQTPTLEPLPAFEFLFPAPTATQIPSPTTLAQQISAEPEPAVQPSLKPLTPRHIVLLVIIALLWVFLVAFLVFLIRNYVHHLEEAEEVNG